MKTGEKLPTAGDRNHSAPPRPSPLTNWLAERVRSFFDRHPEVSREEFFMAAVRREINVREQREARNAYRLGRKSEESSDWPPPRRPPTAEDIRIHAWLAERLAAIQEQHGLWPTLRRFLFGNR